MGIASPNDLADPQPLRLPVNSEKEAAQFASQNNPNVDAALFNAAVANAVYNATGKRIRDLPITLDKLL